MSIIAFLTAARKRVSRHLAGDDELTIGPRPLTSIIEDIDAKVTELKERQAADVAQIAQLDKDIEVIHRRQAAKKADAERAGRIAGRFEDMLK